MLDLDRLAIFPLWPVTDDGKCGCGSSTCTAKSGKHPVFNWKELGPGEKLEGPPGCDYGLATGSRSGVFVIDLDGPEAVEWWTSREPISTYAVKTARGFHLYFTLPPFPVRTSRGVLAANVDVRGEGGMVVTVGARHVSGAIYTEVDQDAEVLPAPNWLLMMPELRGVEREASDNAPIPVDVNTPEGFAALAEGVQAAETFEPSVQGEGGSNKLWQLALHLVRVLRLPLDAAKEIVLTIFNARCTPPWTEGEVWHKLEDARDQSDLWTGHMPSDEEWAALCTRLKMKSAQLQPGFEPTRRQHDPSHVYSFVPGRDVSAMSGAPEARLPVDVANMLASHPDWDGCLQWDTFRNRVVAVDPPFKMDAETAKLSDADAAHLRMWLSCHGTLTTKDDVYDVITAAAKRVSFHPIIEYLESCRDKRVPGILDDLAAWLFGATDPLSQEFLKKTLIAAVRRIYHPGTRVDTSPVLVGPQGAKKSTCIELLFGKDFVRSQMPDLANKDASAALQDFWCVELAEIDRIISRSDNATIKEFLTRTYDDYRPSFGRCDIRQARHNVFIATSNVDGLLTDATGSRRFWPISVQKVNIDYLIEHRDEIWGEALALAEEGVPHWFEDESVVAAAHEPFIVHDPWHDLIRAFLSGKERVTALDVFQNAVGGSAEKFNRAELNRIADTLVRLGCTRKRANGTRWFMVPSELKDKAATKTAGEALRNKPE